MILKSRPRKREARFPLECEKDVASFTEATGLLPSFPPDERDRHAILSLYNIRSLPNWTGQPK